MTAWAGVSAGLKSSKIASVREGLGTSPARGARGPRASASEMRGSAVGFRFGSVSAKKQPGRNLILVNNRSGGVPVRVTGAAVNDGAFDANVITIEDGRLWMLQTRTGKRTGTATIRMAVEMAKERLIDRKEAANPERLTGSIQS